MYNENKVQVTTTDGEKYTGKIMKTARRGRV